MPTTLADVIVSLNEVSQNSQVLVERLKEVFQSHLEWASALIPSYARYLNGPDFDTLSSDFPALQPLLMGYRNLGQA